MNERYFDIQIEFDRSVIFQVIDRITRDNQTGYICSVNANIISHSYLDPSFKSIVNGASLNFCDGSLVALVLQWIHRKKLKPTVGLDLFMDIIKEKKYSSFFLGSSGPVLEGLRAQLSDIDPRIKSMEFLPLPFYDSIEKFDYSGIAGEINRVKPDIIWVSLGAPKQEKFIAKLLPLINRGILFAAGAAFPIFSGDQRYRRAPAFFRSLKLEGIYRVIFHEPRRLFPRVLFELRYMMMAIFLEIKNHNHHNTKSPKEAIKEQNK